MSPISKVSSQIMNVTRLSSTVGVSRVKSPVLAPASFQVITIQTPEPIGFYKKQTETSDDQQAATSEVIHQGISLTKLPSKRWEEKNEVQNSVSIINKL